MRNSTRCKITLEIKNVDQANGLSKVLNKWLRIASTRGDAYMLIHKGDRGDIVDCGSAVMYPMLICGANQIEVTRLRRQFVRLAMEDGAKVTQEKRDRVVLDDCEEILFRSYHNGDSPPGIDFCHIFRDHYARETHE